MLEIKINQNDFSKFLKSLIGGRFANYQELEKIVYERTKLKAVFGEIQNHSDTDDFTWNWFCNVNGVDLFYVELYYILDNKENIYITDYICEFINDKN